MHELSLAQSICQIVTEHVAPGQQVKTVVVDCGPLSGVVPEALEFCFPIAAESAGLGEVELQLRRLTAPARCPACDATFEVDQMWASCPDCDHVPVTVTGGTDFRLKEIEVSDG